MSIDSIGVGRLTQTPTLWRVLVVLATLQIGLVVIQLDFCPFWAHAEMGKLELLGAIGVRKSDEQKECSL